MSVRQRRSSGYVRPNPLESPSTSEQVPEANGCGALWTQAEASLPPPATAEHHLRRYGGISEFTYIMQGAPGTPIKIGRAKDPLKRLATFQTSQWQTVYLLYVFPGGREMERSLHYCMRDSRIRGEWFECDRDFLVWAHDFAEYALDHYLRNLTAVLPPVIPPPPKQALRPHLSKRRKATTVYHA